MVDETFIIVADIFLAIFMVVELAAVLKPKIAANLLAKYYQNGINIAGFEGTVKVTDKSVKRFRVYNFIVCIVIVAVIVGINFA